jgi:hypothetical protein
MAANVDDFLTQLHKKLDQFRPHVYPSMVTPDRNSH